MNAGMSTCPHGTCLLADTPHLVQERMHNVRAFKALAELGYDLFVHLFRKSFKQGLQSIEQGPICHDNGTLRRKVLHGLF